MINGMIPRTAPAGQEEFTLLQSINVGDIRRGLLFPALDIGVEWLCTSKGETYWEFDGLFFGQPLCRAVVTVTDEALTLEVKDVR